METEEIVDTKQEHIPERYIHETNNKENRTWKTQQNQQHS
jgi:hypothetical protein